ncbi:toprim domain-containing protein [Lactococcus lactis]
MRHKVMALATNKDYNDGFTEPVIVFKNFDINGKMIGGARQGIFYNKHRHPKKGRLKRTLFRSDGTSGTWVDIGTKQQFKRSTPEKPFKLYVFEAPIDMMSYYELHKERLNNCRLVAMHGINQAVISRNVLEALCLNQQEMNRVKGSETASSFLNKLDELQYTQSLKIIIATDNDSAGRKFFNAINLPHTKVIPHFAPLHEGNLKADWNEQLMVIKGIQKTNEEELTKKISPEIGKTKFPSIAELEL